MRINAAQRLTAFKAPTVQQVDKQYDKILGAVDALKIWYKDNQDKGVTKFLPALMKAFDYDEYTKPVFRAFPMPPDMVATAQEGKVYELKTGLKAVQSWTTSVEAAQKFIDAQDYKNSKYGIFQLMVDDGKQLCNFKWIRQVVDSLLKTTEGVDDLYEIQMDAKQLKVYLNEFEHEQEVILKLPGKSKVKLMKKLGNS